LVVLDKGKYSDIIEVIKIEPHTHGILNPYPWHFEPLFMVYQTPYPWYIKPPTYFLIKNEGVQNTIGVQFTIQGRFIFQ
jgi:hypothetical protein